MPKVNYPCMLTWIRKTSTRAPDRSLYDEYMCDCGTLCLRVARHVRRGIVRSCGCLKRKRLSLERKGLSPTNALSDPTESSMVALMCAYKSSARNKHHEFCLTKEQFRELTSSKCYYCGAEPSLTRLQHWGREAYTFNGIDRLDNNHGYTVENCVSCCKTCNFMKSNKNVDSFLSLVTIIYKRRCA